MGGEATIITAKVKKATEFYPAGRDAACLLSLLAEAASEGSVMSVHRAMLFVVAGLFTAAMTSVASAGCCGWGVQAPIAYGAGGCGGCGGPSAAAVYAQPVAPVAVGSWGWGGGWAGGAGWGRGWGAGCGCHHAFVYPAAPAIEVTPIAAAPIYVVNQGPDYTGPGIAVPYHTWAPGGSYMGPGAYPYFAGYGGGYGDYGPPPGFVGPGPHVAYRARVYGRHYYRGHVRAYAYQPRN